MERNIHWLPLKRNPDMCLDQELNQQSFTLRDNTHPTENHAGQGSQTLI